jgi:hypothetical protein
MNKKGRGRKKYWIILKKGFGKGAGFRSQDIPNIMQSCEILSQMFGIRDTGGTTFVNLAMHRF